MPGTQLLRLRVNERLAAAAEEIFGLVEKTLAEYQEEAVRSKREIIQLRQQIEQLAVLNPQVVLFRADIQSASEEILPTQQSHQLPDVERNETYDFQQIKEEQVDQCISPDMEVDTSNDAEVRHLESEPANNCELLPSPTAVTMSANGSIKGKWLESDGSPSPRQSQQVNHCIITDLKADSLEDIKVKLPESITATQTDIELFPAFSTTTVPLNDGEWNESAGSHLSSCGLGCSETAFDQQEQSHKDKNVCHFCGRRYNRDSDLIRHIDKIHKNVKAFKCSACGKQFTSQGHLVAHLRVHTGEKPYKCSYCMRSFAQSSNLNVHLRMHTGEKPYFSTSCGKRVARSNHLKTCGLNHERKKPFGCLLCGKTFHAASKLRVHEKIHETRKPYTVL